MLKVSFWFMTAILALLISCNKSPNSASVSFVDSYQPQLLEPRGTVHSENYFPLQPGTVEKDSGISQISLSLHTTMSGPQGGTNDTTETENVVMVSVQSVGAQETITIAGRNLTVTPVKTITTATPVQEPDSSVSVEQTAFYEVTDTAVILSALVEMSDTGYDTISVVNGTVIKKPLVVGNQWESTPTFTFNSSVGSYIKDMKIHSVSHVIGNKSITVNGASIRALRLDQVSEISYSLVGDSLTGNEDEKSTSVSYLEKDTGTVKQELQQNMSMNMTMTLFGTPMTQSETSQSASSQDLVSFTTGNVLSKKIMNDSRTIMPIPLKRERGVAAFKSLTKMQRKMLLQILCLKKAFFM